MNETIEKPLLDTLIESRELQIMKTMVPYMCKEQQKKISMIIKLIELQKTVSLFNSDNPEYTQELHACASVSESERITMMLSAIRTYCTEKERETIDTLLSFFEMSNSYESFFP